MAISITAVVPNKTIPPKLVEPISLRIFSGIVQCVFKGNDDGSISRDTLNFTVGRVNFPGLSLPPVASCIMLLASFAYDGPVKDPLWAVDSASVPNFVNISSGTARFAGRRELSYQRPK